jgi:hypothetical protein
MPRPGRPAPVWTDDEIAQVRHMRANGVPEWRIARTMGRSPYAVAALMRKLRLPAVNHGAAKPERAPEPDIPRAGKTTLPPLPSLE